MPDIEDPDEERAIAPMRRRLWLRMALMVLISLAAIFGAESILGFGFHMYTVPLRWTPIALVSSLAALVGAIGLAAAWRVTRLPPEFPSRRFTLRQSERVQRSLSRLFVYSPLFLGPFAIDGVLLVHNVLHGNLRFLDVTEGFMLALSALAFVLLLTGWGNRSNRLIWDEELFLSFRTRGYIAGFWSIMAGLLLMLALGLARPSWAVEAVPALIAIGRGVPAMTIALLSRRAERDG